MAVVVGTGRFNGPYATHRTIISCYLSVTNIGNHTITIDQVYLGFRWHHRAKLRAIFSRRHWSSGMSISSSNFSKSIGENIVLYPFLMQNRGSDLTLAPGAQITGIAYSEFSECYGNAHPSFRDKKATISIKIRDASGKIHRGKAIVTHVSIDDARKYSPLFGTTLLKMNPDQTEIPVDLDNHGNVITLKQS